MLKAGFIGFGRMGITHFSILNSHDSVEIVSVCDSSKTLMNILGKYVDIKTYSDYREMIDKEVSIVDAPIEKTPTEPKEQITAAIFRARAELEEVVSELENLPSVSKSSISFSAHALNNFLTVTGGAVDLLQLSLADYPDTQVHNLLKALKQSTCLMMQTVGQLTNALSVQDARVMRVAHVFIFR